MTAVICLLLAAAAVTSVLIKVQLTAFSRIQAENPGYNIGSISENSSIKYLPVFFSLSEEEAKKDSSKNTCAKRRMEQGHIYKRRPSQNRIYKDGLHTKYSE